jgi:hypothetical protein
MAKAQPPRINGRFVDYSEITIFVDGKPKIGVKEISYKATREPGKVRGTAPNVLGRTRGDFDFEGSFSMYQEEAADFIATLGAGFMEKDFTVVVTYQPLGGKLVTDTLQGCCITEIDDSHSQGTDPLETKFTIHILGILFNGVSAMAP